MTPYWVVYILFSALSVAQLRVSRLAWLLIGLLLTLFVGLRYEVGGDWFTYVGYLNRVQGVSLATALTYKDPGYQLVNWLSAYFGAEVWLVNTTAALAFVAGLIRFSRTLPDPRIAIAVSIPYMVIVMAMGYTRQAMAFGFVLWGLTYLIQRRLIGFVILLAIAATIHKSAVILIPLAVLANVRNRAWTAIWVGVAGVLLYLLILQEHVDALWDNYVDSSYASSSQGGPIRIAMNLLPAVFFLMARRRFMLSAEERALWTWVSLFTLACVPLVMVSPTAVDRVALYFMPIQLVVASHLAKFVNVNSRVLCRVGVLGLYGTVMFVWLNYAGHRWSWLPYQFWPAA